MSIESEAKTILATAIDRDELSVVKSEEATAQLRYSATGELQQAWKVTTYRDGKPSAVDYEWRGIPVERASDAPEERCLWSPACQCSVCQKIVEGMRARGQNPWQ